MWAAGARDGAPDFTATAVEIYSMTRAQRRRVRKTTVQNASPATTRALTSKAEREFWQAATSEDLGATFQIPAATHDAKYPNSITCLAEDYDSQRSFYVTSASHWQPSRHFPNRHAKPSHRRSGIAIEPRAVTFLCLH